MARPDWTRATVERCYRCSQPHHFKLLGKTRKSSIVEKEETISLNRNGYTCSPGVALIVPSPFPFLYSRSRVQHIPTFISHTYMRFNTPLITTLKLALAWPNKSAQFRLPWFPSCFLRFYSLCQHVRFLCPSRTGSFRSSLSTYGSPLPTRFY